jgi:hypothetical protein
MKTKYLLISTLVLTFATPLLAQPAKPAPPVYGVTALIQTTNKPFGQEIVLEGFPVSVCKRSGKKAWLHDTNSEAAGTVRVERTGAMPAFNQDVLGRTMRVTGTLRELRLDAEYFNSWEARVKASMKARNSDEGEKEEDCTEECSEKVAAETTLKNIAAYRKKLASAKNGYLSAFWVDGKKWELVEAKADQ